MAKTEIHSRRRKPKSSSVSPLLGIGMEGNYLMNTSTDSGDGEPASDGTFCGEIDDVKPELVIDLHSENNSTTQEQEEMENVA